MRLVRFFLILAGVALAFAADPKPKLPDAPGKDTLLRVCGGCHGAEIVLGKRLSRDGWNQIVVTMIQRGAQGTDDEFSEIVDYLSNNLSPNSDKINVNKATAPQLHSALDLTAKEAEAIVSYRDGKGGFKTMDDLKKVPGLDAAKIDARKTKVVF